MRWPKSRCYVIVLLEAISIIVQWSGTLVEKQTIKKIEKIQGRALIIIYRAYEYSYEYLMSAAEAPTMLTRRLRVILLEVLKSMNMLNSDCLNDMFKITDGNYSFRNTRKLVQPK